MEVQELKLSSFQTGSTWNGYKLNNSELSDITPADIERNLQVFKESYNTIIQLLCDGDLICFQLNLEEKRKEKKSKKKKKRTPEKETDKKELKVYVFKVVLSIEDELIFCNRFLSGNFRELFCRVFEAESIDLYDLFGSPPWELILLHRQAHDCTNTHKLQMEKLSLDARLDNTTATENSVFKDIGTSLGRIPKIKKLTSNLKDVPLESKNEAIGDLNMGTVDLELSAPSVFDFYIHLAEKNYISEVSEWVSGCRKGGKTYMSVQYT